jgi:hypothetical protein
MLTSGRPNGILLRRSNASNQPSGVTAFDFRLNWRDRTAAFPAIVADFLGVPAAAVERAIQTFG